MFSDLICLTIETAVSFTKQFIANWSFLFIEKDQIIIEISLLNPL